MNQTFWSSVWLSVAIGVFVGYAITEGQIEATPSRIPEPPREQQGIELESLNAPPPGDPSDPEPSVQITITTSTSQTDESDSAAETTPAEARAHLIQAQHGFPEVSRVSPADPAGGGPSALCT